VRVRRYRPAFFTGFPDEEAYVDTLEQLLAISWISDWTQAEGFHRLSVSEDRLMCELDEGRKWWVVAILECDGAAFGLPQWEPVR
jgi:hypothetical protein